MKWERRKKAESISKKIIREYFIHELKELSIEHGIISITEVEISNDLSYIDIRVSCFTNPDTLTKSLSPYGNEIHRILWKKMKFIKVPKVRFRYDESLEISSSIHTTLKDISL